MNPTWMSLLPRFLLDRLETSEKFLFPPTASSQLDWYRRLSELRIAFVRQDVFRDLYCCHSQMPGEKIVQQSVRRTGPAGLLVDLRADYWILKEDSAPECSVWTEKIAKDPDPRPDAYRAMKDEVPAPGFHSSFGQFAVGVDEVPWESYDLVVSMDISVPFRIVARTRRPIWAYLPGDPGVPTAKRSLRKPPGNYDLSLTHSFRRFPVRPNLGPWTVEFPYTFLRQATWRRIFPSDPETLRQGTMVEHQTEELLSPAERELLRAVGPIRRPEGSIQDVADRLNRSLFYFRCGGGAIVGNGLVEAAAAGCVAFGNHREFVSRSLFSHANLCVTRIQGVEKIRRLNAEPKNLARLQSLQGWLVDQFCFYRPLRDIGKIWEKKRRNRGAKATFPFHGGVPRSDGHR